MYARREARERREETAACRMTPDLSDYDIAEAMWTFGGSFAQGLGRLWRLADEGNRLRIKVAFPDFWAKYKGLALEKRAKIAERERC
jgi:hypothetical protein